MQIKLRTPTLLTSLAAVVIAGGLSLVVSLSHVTAVEAKTACAAYLEKDGVAMAGYDPVSFIAEKTAERGTSRFKFRWCDVDWYFKTANHRLAFRGNPEKYAPQYGGYCAFSMSKGILAEVDYEKAWDVNGGKLFLNWDRLTNLSWKTRRSSFRKSADKNWPTALKELAKGNADVRRK